MPTQKEVKDALPMSIPYYSFNGNLVNFNNRKATPGKGYLDPQEVLVRVYNSTIAREGGFSGEVIAIGDYVDSLGINDYVFGGGVPALQQYITVKADEVAVKPKELNFAEAARLYAGSIVHDALETLQEKSTVLVLGDMTGFAAQICYAKGCLVTSSENFDCGEQNIIESDNFLEWLESHTYKYDTIIDATGDLDLYDHCHKFSHKDATYLSINPESALQAAKSSMLPTFLGGGTRKLKICRAAKGSRKAKSLSSLAARILANELDIKELKIIAYEAVNSVKPSLRYVTAVNILKQADLTPDDPSTGQQEGQASGRKNKGKSSDESRRPEKGQSPSQSSQSAQSRPSHSRSSSYDGLTSSPLRNSPSGFPRSPHSPGSPLINPYSPRRPSRLSQSVSVSNLSELVDSSPSPPSSSEGTFSPPQRVLSFGHIDPNSLGATSPKMTIMARPPALRRHTSSLPNDESHFESVELQNLTSKGSGHQTRQTERSKTDSDVFGGAVNPDQVVLSAEQIRERELAVAKSQIEILQQQVEKLMAAQGDMKEGSPRGLNLFALE